MYITKWWQPAREDPGQKKVAALWTTGPQYSLYVIWSKQNGYYLSLISPFYLIFLLSSFVNIWTRWKWRDNKKHTCKNCSVAYVHDNTHSFNISEIFHIWHIYIYINTLVTQYSGPTYIYLHGDLNLETFMCHTRIRFVIY